MSRASKYNVDVEIGEQRKNTELNCCESIIDFFEDKKYKFSQLSSKQKTKYIIFAFTVFLWFLLAILNIIFGSVFVNTPICQRTSNTTIIPANNSTNSTNSYVERVEEISPTVNLSVWLIVNGVFWLVLLIFSAFYFSIEKIEKNKDTCLEQTKSTYLIVFPFIVVIFIVFLFCWMIVGTVSFWRDCGDNVNKTISGCMYFTLISELVYVVVNVFWLLNKFFWGVMEMCGY
jgi:hypothetical protein